MGSKPQSPATSKRITPLGSVIVGLIQNSGPLRFHEFMNLALYHPDHGYYASVVDPIGKKGDFFTSISVGPLLGELLAAQFASWFEGGVGRELMVVEGGAHRGRFASDFITALRRLSPGLAECTKYVILEPSTMLRELQQASLAKQEGSVAWCPGWDELGPGSIRGLILSNELLDAFPVHRLGWDQASRKWFEWGVDLGEEGLQWCRLALDEGPILRALPKCITGCGGSLFELFGLGYAADLEDVLPDGFTIELGPDAASWWHGAAEALAEGWLLTVDYGMKAEEWISPKRPEGTLRGYVRHAVSPDPLARPGEQDLTAHVNFTILERVGEAAGLGTVAYETQARFLARILGMLEQRSGLGTWDAARARQFKTLFHPDHLGQTHKVLLQRRGGS